jgi:hypothetical protein
MRGIAEKQTTGVFGAEGDLNRARIYGIEVSMEEMTPKASQLLERALDLSTEERRLLKN